MPITPSHPVQTAEPAPLLEVERVANLVAKTQPIWSGNLIAVCKLARAALREGAVQPAEASPESVWQYYYAVNECRAKNSRDPDCRCWHNEGTGPYPEARYPPRSWRALRELTEAPTREAALVERLERAISTATQSIAPSGETHPQMQARRGRNEDELAEARTALLRALASLSTETAPAEPAEAEVFSGLPFSEAKARILALNAADARGLAISLMITLGIERKYAKPAEAPETLTDLLVTIEISVARDGAVHSDVQTHDNSWADVAIGLAAAKKEIELNFSERSKCPYHPSTREEANRKIVRATPPTALQEGAETLSVDQLMTLAHDYAMEAWTIGKEDRKGGYGQCKQRSALEAALRGAVQAPEARPMPVDTRDTIEALKREYGTLKTHHRTQYWDFERHVYVGRAIAMLGQALAFDAARSPTQELPK